MPSKPLKILGNSRKKMGRLESAQPCLRYIRASFEAWGYIYDNINVFGRRLQRAWIHSKEAKLAGLNYWQRHAEGHAHALLCTFNYDTTLWQLILHLTSKTVWENQLRHIQPKALKCELFSVENSEFMTAHLVRHVQLLKYICPSPLSVTINTINRTDIVYRK